MVDRYNKDRVDPDQTKMDCNSIYLYAISLMLAKLHFEQ